MLPKNKSERKTFAVEGFRVDVQHTIYKAMRARGMTERDLAKKMGVSEARVHEFFSDECKLTIRKVAKILYALGFECELSIRPKGTR